MFRHTVNIDELINEALALDDDRARRILVERYGIGGKKRKTLAALGKEYKLTRERVRQIQAHALASVRKTIKEHREAVRLLGHLEEYLEDVGKIRRADHLARDFRILLERDEDEEEFYNKLHLLADILEWPHISGGNDRWHEAWHSEPGAFKRAQDIAKHLLGMKEHDFDKFVGSARTKFRMTEPEIMHHITISKRFGVGPYGDLGADHWVHVNPKTVRDKVYLVLLKEGEPMHFQDIAEKVNALGDRRRAAATVHNELIKDPRFELVSRGTYALGG